MNKAITDGVTLMPLPFVAGLGLWSSGDGLPGSDTYANSDAVACVPSDQDFGDCLELQKIAGTQKLRFMGETPLLPGCYLLISARVKAVAGPMPMVRIAGWAGQAGGSAITMPTQTGPAYQLSTYGDVVTVQAIVGTGDRTGVDMVWNGANFGHFGINLTGPDGGIVRVDNIQIKDITTAFLRNMMAMVDVRDYGARGDGQTDDSAAFLAADAAAKGREVLVSDGVYQLDQNVTMANRMRFEGRISQPTDKWFVVQKDFHYQTYVDAFDDDELAFRKAYQALLRSTTHAVLDLGGRIIPLHAPLDMQSCDPECRHFAQRRIIRNGQFQAIAGPGWETIVVTSRASVDRRNPTTLTDVSHVAEIAVGAVVKDGLYVRACDVRGGTVELSGPLHHAEGVQVLTFLRQTSLLDFSGYDTVLNCVLDDIAFECRGLARSVMLPPLAQGVQMRNCDVIDPV